MHSRETLLIQDQAERRVVTDSRDPRRRGQQQILRKLPEDQPLGRPGAAGLSRLSPCSYHAPPTRRAHVPLQPRFSQQFTGKAARQALLLGLWPSCRCTGGGISPENLGSLLLSGGADADHRAPRRRLASAALAASAGRERAHTPGFKPTTLLCLRVIEGMKAVRDEFASPPLIPGSKLFPPPPI